MSDCRPGDGVHRASYRLVGDKSLMRFPRLRFQDLDQPGQRAGQPLADLRHAHGIVISCAARRG